MTRVDQVIVDSGINPLAAGDGDRHAADVGGIEADATVLLSLLGGELWTWKTPRAGLETSYQSPMVTKLWALPMGLAPESTHSGEMGKIISCILNAAVAQVPGLGGGSGYNVAKRLGG